MTNRGFRPTRHGLLYHVNVGHPLLGEAARLFGEGWTLRDRLDDASAIPADDHVEIVDVASAPPAGEIGIMNDDLGFGLALRFDPAVLPVAALWRAFQSGVFALGLEPQTRFEDDDGQTLLAAVETRTYGLGLEVVSR